MAGVATINIQYTVAGGPQAFAPTPPVIAAPIGAVTSVVLANGANTILIPSGTSYICILPPSTNTIALLLKQTTGDAGLKMSKVNPTAFAVDPANNDASFVITAASATSGATLIYFI